jgi:hypothetical protein
MTIVGELEMIIRPVYDSRNPPNAISNVRNIRVGERILLVFGAGGQYSPVFVCTVVTPRVPIPGFNACSFADELQSERLTRSGYTIDPHLGRFTGVSVKAVPLELSISIRKPKGNTIIRKWQEVALCNPGRM